MQGMCLLSVMWMRQKNSCRNVRMRWCMRMRHMRYPLRSRIRRSNYGRVRLRIRTNFQQNRLRKKRAQKMITIRRLPQNRKMNGTISSFTNTACKRSMSRWLYISRSLMMERLRQSTAVLSLTLRS